MKEERLAILRMLENGVISTDEAERLLNILNENSQKSGGSFEDAFSKAGNTLENVVESVSKKVGTAAKTVGDKAEEAKPEIKRAVKTVVEKVSEAAETIKAEFNNRNAAKNTAETSDFVYEGEADEKDAVDKKESQEDADRNREAQNTRTESFSDAEDSDSSENENIEDIQERQAENNAASDDDDGRDYESEYYQMMKETNGGDIFGDVYKAMDNLKGIDSSKDEAADNAEADKTDKE